MRNMSKLLAVVAAAALLAVAVNDAAARNFSLSERNFELIWNNALGKLASDLAVIGNGGAATCPITLSGSFSGSTIAKRTEPNQGTITAGSVGTCNAGSITVRSETMPWNIRYQGFSGTLPRITGVTFSIFGGTFRTEASGRTCEFSTEVNHPGLFILESFSSGSPEYVRADETRTIPGGGEDLLCSFFAEVEFRGVGAMRNLPGTARVTISLI